MNFLLASVMACNGFHLQGYPFPLSALIWNPPIEKKFECIIQQLLTRIGDNIVVKLEHIAYEEEKISARLYICPKKGTRFQELSIENQTNGYFSIYSPAGGKGIVFSNALLVWAKYYYPSPVEG